MRHTHPLKDASSGQNGTKARKMSYEFKSSARSVKRGTSLSQINNDTMEEIFSRMSAKTISLSKCVCTRWNNIMSQNSFIHHYAQRPASISGLFFQQHEEIHKLSKPVFHVPLETEQPKMQKKVLDFLPEKVCVMSSSNGLLCCRSFPNRLTLNVPGGRVIGHISSAQIPKIYICNPNSKEFKVIDPSMGGMGINIGLSFDPIKGNFQLVTIYFRQLLNLSWLFTVNIFSSQTWSWRVLGVVFHWNSPIHRHKHVYVKGHFHWLTTNHHVMTFDMEKEVAGIVRLPGPIMEGRGYRGVCLGSSGDRLAYVVVHPLEIRVWTLKDYGNSEWSLENQLPLIEFYEENTPMLRRQLLLLLLKDKDNVETQTNAAVIPLGFRDGVLYVVLHRVLYSFEFKTGDLKKHFDVKGMNCDISLSPIVVPYEDNLLALNFLSGLTRAS